MMQVQTLPSASVTVNGIDLDDAAGTILELEVAQRTYDPSACEVRLRARGDAASSLITTGSPMSVRIGVEQRSIFEGTIVAVEYIFGPAGEQQVRLLAYDALDALRRRMPVRVHVDTTFADLARELTADAGLSVDCASSTPVQRRIVQHRRSDLDLLAEVAERAGLGFCVEGGVLRAYPLEGEGAPVEFVRGSSLRELRVLSSDEPTVSGVDVHGWDSGHAEARHGSARGEGASGVALALTNIEIESDANADVLARAQLGRRVLAALHLCAVVEGDARLRPGMRATLSGVGDHLAGPYCIMESTHRFTRDQGYTTTLSSAVPRPHPPSQDVSATLGIVVDVRDPESLGRIKVKYPALANAESDWLQIVAAGAGGNKGLVAVPAIDDKVLVLTLCDDPSHGIVLGALYGTSGMPKRKETSFSGYAFFSPQGHVIEMNDDDALSIRAKGGSYIELGSKRTMVHSESDIVMEAQGKTITIRADRVDFEQS
jgi:phage protein D/phage baseplate assembly protein gpV